MIKTFTEKDINNQNTYLIINGNRSILIDAGKKIDEIINYTQKNNLIIEAVIITHGHYDHLLGLNNLLNNYPKIKLYINQKDERCLTDGKYNLSSLRFSEPFTIKKKITNLQIITEEITKINLIGYDFTIKHIFGHTPGSQYIIFDNDQSIFIGDTIFYDKIGFYELPYTDYNGFKNSLIEIINLPINYYVYPGHHQSFFLHEVKSNNKILNDFIK